MMEQVDQLFHNLSFMSIILIYPILLVSSTLLIAYI